MKNNIDLSLYDVLISPITTEKSTKQSEYNQFSFFVKKAIDKKHIKKAVELFFDVKVDTVNTLIVKGKKKRFRGRVSQQKDYKKAVVKLSKGQVIDLTAGI